MSQCLNVSMSQCLNVSRNGLEILIEMEIEILDGQSSGLFSNEPFEKRPVMTIEDFR